MDDRLLDDLRCPRCGDLMTGGRCGNRSCEYHRAPMTGDESRAQEEETEER